MSLSPGTKFAHDEILEPIGKGGMGEVHRATDSKLGRDVAIKVLPDEFALDATRMGVILGSIEPGSTKYADLAAWDKNLYEIPTEELETIECQMTFFEGEIGFERDRTGE